MGLSPGTATAGTIGRHFVTVTAIAASGGSPPYSHAWQGVARTRMGRQDTHCIARGHQDTHCIASVATVTTRAQQIDMVILDDAHANRPCRFC
jgi:hypothetical protein